MRVKENAYIYFTIKNTGQKAFETNEPLKIEGKIDDITFYKETLESIHLDPGETYSVKNLLNVKKIGEHNLTGSISYKIFKDKFNEEIEVKPPLNSPLESLKASIIDTKESLKVLLKPVSAWDYEETVWNAPSEVSVYWNRLLREEKTHIKTYNISGNTPSFTIPYEEFYEDDGNYTVKIEFLGENVEKTIGVAGEDGVYDPPNELVWLLTVVWIGLALTIAYTIKSYYSKN